MRPHTNPQNLLDARLDEFTLSTGVRTCNTDRNMKHTPIMRQYNNYLGEITGFKDRLPRFGFWVPTFSMWPRTNYFSVPRFPHLLDWEE